MTQITAELATEQEPVVEVYQFHFLLLEISPARWRRVLLRSDSTIFDLHYVLQIAFGWSDTHLHQFKLHAKTYGIYHPGGPSFDTDPKKVRLHELKLRLKERFEYQYDFSVNWRVQIRLEKKLAASPHQVYPLCLSGARLVPPEECGGPAAFTEIEVKLELAVWEKKWRLMELMTQILPPLLEGESRAEVVEPHRAELEQLLAELKAAEFNREAINTRLKQYVEDDPAWLEGFNLLI
jgi:hypothetical protein